MQLLFQPWICAPGTHYGWVDRGSVDYEVCPTLVHMASPDLLILSPTPYPLDHVLPPIKYILKGYSLSRGEISVDISLNVN